MSITNVETDSISLYNLGNVTTKILKYISVIDQTFSINVKHLNSKFATVKQLLSFRY